MTAKEYLRQYRDADDAINAKLDQIHRLRELATKTTTAMSPARVKSSGEPDKLAGIIARIVDMEREVDDSIDRLQDTKRQVEDAIAGVRDPRERKVLTLRYINGLRWEEIAVRLNYDYRWVLRLHGKALEKLNTPQKATMICAKMYNGSMR